MAADDRDHRGTGAADDDDASPSDAEFGVRLTWPGAPGDVHGDDLAAPTGDTPDAQTADAPDPAADPAPEAGTEAEADADTGGSPGRDPFGGARIDYETATSSWSPRSAVASSSGDHGESETYAGVPFDSDTAGLGGGIGTGVAGRIETLHTALNALAMRVEALVSGTSGMRSALGDRLNDHADTLGRLVRSQASDFEEFQRGTDRTLTDLRRTSADTDEAVQRVADRLDELATEIGGLGRQVEATVDEGRDLASASDKLSRQVVEGLDAFGDRLLERLDDLDATLAAEVTAARSEVAHVRALMGDLSQTGEGTELHVQLGRLREELADLNDTAEELPNLRAELARLRADVTNGPGLDAVAEELAALRSSLAEVRRQQDELAEAAQGLLSLQDAIELVPADDGAYAEGGGAAGVLPGELADLRAELASLRADLIELTSNDGMGSAAAAELAGLRSEVAGLGRSGRGGGGTSDEGLEAVRVELAALRRRMNLKAKPAAVTLDDDQLARLADEVGARLRTILELDPDDRG
jgi:prefoldin subunit 5